ncbi:MAG: hypothetical protein WC326_13220 [Candidatus Delongbacteria bacterium]
MIIFIGVTTFVIGQILVKLVIDPVQDMKKCIAEIAHSLIELAQFYANPGVASLDVETSASRQLRNLSCQLVSRLYLVPFRTLTMFLFNLPNNDDIYNASKQLIALSNGFQKTELLNMATINLVRAQKIKDCLGIYQPENERISAVRMRELGVPDAI